MKKPFRSEKLVLAAHYHWFGKISVRIITAAASILLYAVALLCLAPAMEVAVNYFVVVPVIVCSLAFGIAGGTVSGVLALTTNNALLIIRGLPEFMPENHPVAQITGLVLGTTLGILTSHYKNLGREIVRRREIDDRLRSVLKERTLLLREVHHRVKNNLNVIHSLIGLQSGYLKDAASVELLNDLSRRIGSMAFVHDQLNDKPYSGALKLNRYIPSLVEHILSSHSTAKIETVYQLDENLPEITLSRATSLGLIINEVVTNSLKHAFNNNPDPRLQIVMASEGEHIILRISDNGPGYKLESVTTGLGSSLIEALVRQLEGDCGYSLLAGCEFALEIPVYDSSQDIDLMEG